MPWRKMALKFAANLSTMFLEHPGLCERYGAAKRAGFRGVEATFLYGVPLSEVVSAKRNACVDQVLLNSFPGNLEQGDLGLAALPSRTAEFKDTFELSVKYCKGLECKRLHIMAGKTDKESSDHATMEKTYIENLKYASEILAKEDIIGVLEPINRHTIAGYFLNNYDKAIKVIDEVGSPNIKLQLDLFHLQQICGNVTHMIKTLFPYIGHIQIAQVPDRHEPNSAGELRFDYVFKLLEELGYDGWIGCEYFPERGTEDGLKWIQEYGYSL